MTKAILGHFTKQAFFTKLLSGEDLYLRPLGYENNGSRFCLVLSQFASGPILFCQLELELGLFSISAFLFCVSLAGFVKKC